MNYDTVPVNALRYLKLTENNKIESFVQREFRDSNSRRRAFN